MARSGEITLPKVVQGRLLEVADYQRPYAWELKQLTDLWDDLDLLGKGVHYAGTLVIKDMQLPEDLASDGDALARYEVVDGQQRLTTCFLLLDRVRRALVAIDSTTAHEVAHRLGATFGLLKISGVDVPRLNLGSDLKSFWRDSVLGEKPITDATLIAGAQRLRSATQFFDERLGALTGGLEAESAVAKLVELQRRVVSGLRFLVYEVQSDAEVGVVFETLNERGRSLTDLEKVKNYLLYLARQLPDAQMHDLAYKINEAWSHIFNMLARRPPAFEERLLRAHWISTVEPDARQWKRTASIKARFPRSRYVSTSERLTEAPVVTDNPDVADLLYEELETYVASLRASATFLAEMYDDKAEYNSFTEKRAEIRSATAALRRSPVIAIFQPVLLAFRLAHASNASAYLDLIRTCETYSARVFAICQRRSNAGEPYLARVANDVHQGRATPDQAVDHITALLREYASDDEVRQNLLGNSNWYARNAHKYLLYEYERSFAKSDSDVITWEDIVDAKARKTTEHVLPQHPDPGSHWCSTFTEQEQDELRHTLGNLVLTYDNSAYSNKDYAEKRGKPGGQASTCYFAASLRSEVDIANRFADWTPESIRERQRLIADWAMRRWHVGTPSPKNAQAAEEELAEEMETLGTEPSSVG